MAVSRRGDVATAGDDQPVDAGEYPRGDADVDRLRWQQRGDPAGAGDAVQVGLGQETGTDISRPGLRLLQVGGHPDHRASRRKGLRNAGVAGVFVSARGEIRAAQSHALVPNR